MLSSGFDGMIYAAVILAPFLVCVVKADVPPINEDDPELYVEWTTPRSFDYWWRYTPGAEYVGNLFAGRAEFPWVVDIRSIDLDSEQWSTGNLVTLSHVLTTARALEFIINDQRFKLLYEKGQEVDEGLLLSFEYIGVDINFCGNYLWEEYKFNTRVHQLLHTDTNVFDHDVKDSGSRYAQFLYRHPNWKKETISWDIGVIKVNHPIRPIPPVVDHMPIWFDNEKGQVTDVDLSDMERQRRVCYIASFGRSWYNLAGSYVTDYKVRYRVYFLDMNICLRKLHLFRRTVPNEPLVFENRQGKDKDYLMCFGTRARVGAICDHDRGAPLVCDGRVYGFLVRGANFTNCNNLLPLPFLVQKGSLLNQYYASIIRHVFVPKFVPRKDSTGRNSACAYMLVFTFLLSLWHNKPNHHVFSTLQHTAN